MSLDDEREERIVEKASYVEEAVTVLKRKQDLSEETYLRDREQRAIVEREFQTAIEACLDVASIICKAIGEDVPAENAEKFAVLARQGVLLAETADRMKEAAGFRNVLAHNYGGDIDDAADRWLETAVVPPEEDAGDG